jgi:hypothetical protein
LDQPIENCPAMTAGMTSPTGPAPSGAACAASSAIIAEIASDGPGCPARTRARTRFATPTALPIFAGLPVFPGETIVITEKPPAGCEPSSS